jgi:WD40 repeat protein
MNLCKSSPVVALGSLLLVVACADEPRVSTPLSVSGDPGAAPREPSVGAAAPAASPAVADPPACASVLTPPVPANVPIELTNAAGSWQRCGAYGSGPAKVMRVAAGGTRAVVTTGSGDAFVLSFPDLALVGAFAHGTGRAGYAALSPDGRTLATLDDRIGMVGVWDVDSHALVRAFRRDPAWPSYTSDTADLAFSSDGTRLAIGSITGIDVYDLTSGTPLPISLRSDTGTANRLAFVAGDTRLAVATYGLYGNGPYLGGIRVDLMDADTGDHRVTLPATYGVAVPIMAASRDGHTVAVSTEGGSLGLHFYDADTGAEIATSQVIYGELLGLSPDGTRVAVIEGDWRNIVAVRRVADGTLVSQVTAPNFYPMGSQRGPIEVSPDLETALFGDVPPAIVTTAALADGATLGHACGDGHAHGVEGLLVSRDGTRLVTGSEGVTKVWDVATGAPVDEPPPTDVESMDATSPDGRQVAVPRGDEYFDVRDVRSGSPVAVFGPQLTRVTAVDWSADGAYLLSVAERDPVDRGGTPPFTKIWSRASGHLVQDLPSFEAPAMFAPAGEQVFVSGEGSVETWCH